MALADGPLGLCPEVFERIPRTRLYNGQIEFFRWQANQKAGDGTLPRR
jgi:hypothetical protein